MATQTRTNPRRRAASSTAAPKSKSEFEARLKRAASQGKIPEDATDPELFDDWADAADLLKHYNSAEVEPLGQRDVARSQRAAKTTKRTRAADKSAKAKPGVRTGTPKTRAAGKPATKAKPGVRTGTPKTRAGGGTGGRAEPRPRSGKPKTRAAGKIVGKRRTAASSPTTRRSGTSKNRAASKISDLVVPGLSLGPPERSIGVQVIRPKIKVSEAKFRRQRVGVGKCTGSNLTDVRRAFAEAYMMLECAKEDVRSIIAASEDARILWHASLEHESASLSHWFGEEYTQKQTMQMLRHIDDILTEWSLAFCGGFRDLLPVFIRCKSKNGVGGGPARHLVENTIELFPRYFDMTEAQRTITMLHEMGHRCKSLLKPRDERHDLCRGGWNSDENMCYRDRREVDGYDDLFEVGNPRTLAVAATSGNGSAKKAMLNNIDNYVCFIWNRYIDRAEWEMYLRAAGAAKPKPLPPGPTKPLPGNSPRSKSARGSSSSKPKPLPKSKSSSSKPKRSSTTSKPKPLPKSKVTTPTKKSDSGSRKTKPIKKK
jgi:hypothetical protein